MRILDMFKKEKKEEQKRPILTKEQRTAKDLAIKSHENRIANLNVELETLSKRLESLELDLDVTKTAKQKESDTIIRRMSIIKYETDIREGLIKWLS